jgi:hypothetical protein
VIIINNFKPICNEIRYFSTTFLSQKPIKSRNSFTTFIIYDLIIIKIKEYI